MSEKIIQVKLTITEPSRFPMEGEWLRPISKAIPEKAKLIAEATRK